MRIESEYLNVLESNKEKTEETSNKLAEIRARIKNGESTGDKIKDFMIVYYSNVSYGAVDDSLRLLQGNIDKHQQEQILVINKCETVKGCTGYGHPGFYGLDESLRIGLLQGDLDFDLNSGSIVIPTGKHVQKGWTHNQIVLPPKPQKIELLSKGEWELFEGPIAISGYEFSKIDNDLPHRRLREEVGERDLGSNLRILVGNWNVELYFKLPEIHLWDILREKQKGAIDDKEIDNLVNKFGGLDTNYVTALELLGKDAPAEFKEKYNKKLKEEKYKIVYELDRLINEASKLDDRIKAIFDSAKSGGYIENGAIVMVEDKETAFFASYGTQEKLKDSQKDIAKYLTRAVGLNMHKNELKMPGDKPGYTINVPEFISILCKIYDVKIS